jgi:hypothetical protein
VSRLVRWLLAAFALALAPVLLFQAQANALQPGGPWLTLNGFNTAELARAGLRLRQAEGTATLTVESNALAMARRAFVQEPLATNALFVLAIDERAAAGGQSEQALLDAAVALDQRNHFLGGLQMEQLARAGDFARTFALLDRLARVHPEMTSEFVQPLVMSLRQDDASDVIAGALASDPVWANSFWRTVPNDPVLVAKMLQLRQRTARGTDRESDAALLNGLVTTGQFEAAFSLRDRLRGSPVQGTGFVAAGEAEPFGWQVEARGDRAMSLRNDDSYDIFVQQGTSGELGRQLLRLGSGTYVFSAALTPVSQANNVTVKLRCAIRNGMETATQSLAGPVRIAVPGGCRTWWLVLGASAWSVSGGLRARISEMRFEAAT